jgi:hypothetical protein
LEFDESHRIVDRMHGQGRHADVVRRVGVLGKAGRRLGVGSLACGMRAGCGVVA